MPATVTAEKFRSLLDAALAKAAAHDWQTTISMTDELLTLLHETTPHEATWLAQVWLLKANALRDSRSADADAAYLKALNHLQTFESADDETTNLQANVWTNRGIALLDAGSETALQQAVACFERAIALRQELPLQSSPLYPWGLSAAWMNRADALMQLQPVENRPEAQRCYQEALKVLAVMKPGDHPSLPARVALAWMNLGLLCSDEENADNRSRQSLDAAVQMAGSEAAAGNAECRRVLIGALLARGSTLITKDPAQAWQDAHDSLSLTASLEQRELLAAEAGIKARHLLCQVITRQPSVATQDWVTEATDAVDDGMALSRFWRQHGERRLDEWACELFRFGLLVYQIWQPHFLAEFILECLDPEVSAGAPVENAAMHHLATEMIWRAVVALNQESKSGTHTDEAQHEILLQRLHHLQQAEQRLQALRSQHVQPAAAV